MPPPPGPLPTTSTSTSTANSSTANKTTPSPPPPLPLKLAPGEGGYVALFWDRVIDEMKLVDAEREKVADKMSLKGLGFRDNSDGSSSSNGASAEDVTNQPQAAAAVDVVAELNLDAPLDRIAPQPMNQNPLAHPLGQAPSASPENSPKTKSESKEPEPLKPRSKEDPMFDAYTKKIATKRVVEKMKVELALSTGLPEGLRDSVVRCLEVEPKYATGGFYLKVEEQRQREYDRKYYKWKREVVMPWVEKQIESVMERVSFEANDLFLKGQILGVRVERPPEYPDWYKGYERKDINLDSVLKEELMKLGVTVKKLDSVSGEVWQYVEIECGGEKKPSEKNQHNSDSPEDESDLGSRANEDPLGRIRAIQEARKKLVIEAVRFIQSQCVSSAAGGDEFLRLQLWRHDHDDETDTGVVFDVCSKARNIIATTKNLYGVNTTHGFESRERTLRKVQEQLERNGFSVQILNLYCGLLELQW